jgi:hypothetical protein
VARPEKKASGKTLTWIMQEIVKLLSGLINRCLLKHFDENNDRPTEFCSNDEWGCEACSIGHKKVKEHSQEATVCKVKNFDGITRAKVS